jgi:hypothetical protein
VRPNVASQAPGKPSHLCNTKLRLREKLASVDIGSLAVYITTLSLVKLHKRWVQTVVHEHHEALSEGYHLLSSSLCTCTYICTYIFFLGCCYLFFGRDIAQVVNGRLPTKVAWVRGQVMRYLWWTKWHWGRFSPSTSVSPANSHSIDCSTFIIIYHPGLVQ